MNYLNAKEILPPDLLRELQKHINGVVLYIPSPEEKKSWGLKNGSREKYDTRNKEIKDLYYKEGKSVAILAEEFFLSTDSIRKILK